MNYKKVKHFRQDSDLKKIILTANFYFIFQLKAIKILDWVLLKQKFSNKNLKIRVLPIKLLKNNLLLNFKLLNKIHTGNILIVYANNGYSYSTFINGCNFIFETNPFLIPLYLFVNSRFYLFENLKILSEINHIIFARIILHVHNYNLLKILLNKNL